MEDVIDADYKHAKNIYEEFKLNNLGDYHENFRNKCIKINELDSAHFLSVSVLAWQACLKKTEIKLELLTDADILLMVEKGIRGGICHAIHRYAKAKNKYVKKDIIKTKNH